MPVRLELVEYIGKQNKKVATLLTAEVVCALNALVKHRTKCGIKEENQYLFANQGIGPIPNCHGCQTTWPTTSQHINFLQTT